MHARFVPLAAAVGALCLLTAACGDDDSTASTGTTAAEETTTSAAGETTTTAGEAAEGTVVEAVESDLGSILAYEGSTVYLFMPDNAGAPTCSGACAETWPPLLAEGGASAGTGVDPSVVGTVARDDGGEQVTAGGWPLYVFSGDSAPGDTNGQGIGGVWYVVAPDGTAVTG